MSLNIEKALTTAGVLADYVDNGLADNPANQTLAKDVAESLRKLIVKATADLCSAEPLVSPATAERYNAKLSQASTSAPKMAPRKAGDIEIKEGDVLDYLYAIEWSTWDFHSGMSGSRKWHKTTFKAPNSDMRFVLWDETPLKKGEWIKDLLPSHPFRQRIQNKCFEVKKVTKKGATKFNKTFDEITIKFCK